MKASELIISIVNRAEQKFRVTNHPQDTVSVVVYPDGYGWQAFLIRPTGPQLDVDKKFPPLGHLSHMCYEYETHFYVRADTYMGALKKLRELLKVTPMGGSVPKYAEKASS